SRAHERARSVLGRSAEELGEELSDMQTVGTLHERGNARIDLYALVLRWLSFVDPNGRTYEIGEQRKGRCATGALGLGKPDGAGGAHGDAAHKLLRQPGLADARGRDDRHGASDPLENALVVDGQEPRDLPLATDTRRRTAKQHALARAGWALACE